MPRLSPKERVSRRYKEHIDSLTEGENSHEHPPSFFPVWQERVAAGGVLCYILRCVCGHSLKKARALSLERNHQASAADGLRMYGNRHSLCLPAAQTRTVRGSVVDENDTPVIGATVIVKDSPTLGTSTDVNGEFVLKDLPAGGGGNYRFPMWVIRPGQ